MILYPFLAEIPLVLHGLAERLAETDLSAFGALVGCLIVFRIVTLRKKTDKPEGSGPPGPAEAEPIRQPASTRDDRRD